MGVASLEKLRIYTTNFPPQYNPEPMQLLLLRN